jgi:hypothetical protein
MALPTQGAPDIQYAPRGLELVAFYIVIYSLYTHERVRTHHAHRGYKAPHEREERGCRMANTNTAVVCCVMEGGGGGCFGYIGPPNGPIQRPKPITYVQCDCCKTTARSETRKLARVGPARCLRLGPGGYGLKIGKNGHLERPNSHNIEGGTVLRCEKWRVPEAEPRAPSKIK